MGIRESNIKRTGIKKINNPDVPLHEREFLLNDYYTKAFVFLLRTYKKNLTRRDFIQFFNKPETFDTRFRKFLIAKKIITKNKHSYILSNDKLLDYISIKFYDYFNNNCLKKYSKYTKEYDKINLKILNNNIRKDKIYYKEKFDSKVVLKSKDLSLPREMKKSVELGHLLHLNSFLKHLNNIIWDKENYSMICKKHKGFSNDCYAKCNDLEIINFIHSFEWVFDSILSKEEESFLLGEESEIGKAFFIVNHIQLVQAKKLMAKHNTKKKISKKLKKHRIKVKRGDNKNKQ